MNRYVGTARKEGVENKKPRWVLKVTDTQTNKIVEETSIITMNTESAIARAYELAHKWGDKDESNSS